MLAACGTGGEESPSDQDPGPAPPVTAATTTEAPAAGATTSVSPEPAPTPDLTVFIAAINDAMAGTSYEDAALEDAEVFIAVGRLFCELLDEGATVDEVLSEYLDALIDPETGTVAEDDSLVAGVVMGASIEVLCPQHRSGL